MKKKQIYWEVVVWDETKHLPQNSRCKVAVHVAVVDVRNGMGHRLRGF